MGFKIVVDSEMCPFLSGYYCSKKEFDHPDGNKCDMYKIPSADECPIEFKEGT